MAERLQKLISSAGLMSRRAAEECILAGRVTVNGSIASLGDKADAATDVIMVDGRALPSANEKMYIMLNKPKGYVCTLNDEKGRRNVTELVSIPNVRLYPVGRLDMYSEGLLLMTNDGDFANRLMHPSYEIRKTYRTWVQGQDVGLAVEYLRAPMEIDEYIVCADFVDIEGVFPGGAVLSITISEGRNRQVRKMCSQCGLKVTKLVRISEGPLDLGDLPLGKWRYLEPSELDMLNKS
ncbi:MAG: rRNA pseudouridine synthase [Oscillospiraceae bacterium]|nr:rRNA pseudouridine synthase [Oscillospiraceae bacterium]